LEERAAPVPAFRTRLGMGSLCLEIESIVVGSVSRAPAVPRVRLELATERITVRDLIARTVRQQIAELIEQRRVSQDEALRALEQQYLKASLTADEIAEQAATGRVSLHGPGDRRPGDLKFSVDNEVRKAIDGFRNRAYLVMRDGVPLPASDLDTDIVLTPKTKITFLRLTPLVGG
jgi:hypothetical protein